MLRASGIRARLVGVAVHGLGTARGFQAEATTGTVAGPGNTLKGVLLTALLVPVTVWLFGLYTLKREIHDNLDLTADRPAIRPLALTNPEIGAIQG